MDLNREPTAAEVAAYLATKAAEYGSYAIIAACIALAWVGTP